MRVETDAGDVIDLGQVETTPTIGITDYSRRVTDDFGVTTVVERGFARTLSVRLAVPVEEVDDLQRDLAGLRATAATWIADDDIAWLSVRGFYKSFDLDLAVPPLSYCSLTVEGLTETEVGADPGGDPSPTGMSSTLQLLQPVTVTDPVLTSSSVPETDQPEWDATVAYPSGALVIRAASHRVYEALAATMGEDPATSPGKWLDSGPTARWAMFDQALGTVTTATGQIVVTLAAGEVDAVALLDVAAASVRVQATGYDRTIPAGAGAITFLDLPLASGQVTVTVTGDGDVSVGTLLIGRLVDLGVTEASPTAGITDFSRKEIDDFGEVTVVQRAWAKRMTAKALIRTDAVDQVANRIAAVRALPSLWIGDAGLDSLTVYGFFKDFSIEVGETTAKLSLSIEGFSAAAAVLPLGAGVDWPDINDPDGTKPDDNATNTGDPASPWGPGNTVGDAISDLHINTVSIIAEALRQDQLLQVVDARTFVEGQPVSVTFLAFRNQQITTNSAVASQLALIGAKAPSGTAWDLSLDTVRVSPEETLAQRFTEIGATTAQATASIQSLQEVLIDADGGVTAKAVLALDVNGKVVGVVATNDGSLGVLDLLFDAVIIRDPISGLPLFTADTVAGVVKARNLEVDRLKVNTAIVPARAAASEPVTSPDVYSTILSVTITLPIAGWIEATAAIRQSFSDGDHGWGYQLLIDGDNVFEVTGGRTQDSIPLLGAKLCSPGDHTVAIRFNANPSVTVYDRSMFVKGFPATE